MKKTQTLFATVVLLGFFAPAQAADRLSGNELSALFSGRTISHISPRSGQRVLMVFSSGGSLHGTVGRRSENGRWWISGDLLCFQFPTLEKGTRICHSLVRVGSNQLKRLSPKNGRPKRGENWVIVR
jgi:hypothetical protein